MCLLMCSCDVSTAAAAADASHVIMPCRDEAAKMEEKEAKVKEIEKDNIKAKSKVRVTWGRCCVIVRVSGGVDNARPDEAGVVAALGVCHRTRTVAISSALVPQRTSTAVPLCWMRLSCPYAFPARPGPAQMTKAEKERLKKEKAKVRRGAAGLGV